MVVTRHRIRSDPKSGAAPSLRGQARDASEITGRTLRRVSGNSSARSLEARLLVAAIGLAALGLLQVYRGVAVDFSRTNQLLDSGQVVLLDATATPANLLPLLRFVGDPEEREFVAQRLSDWLRQTLAEREPEPAESVRADPGGGAQTTSREPASRRLPNVGELSRVRVEIESFRGIHLPALNARASAAREATSVALFDAAQLRQLKGSVVVRVPAESRRSIFGWSAAALAAFALVHLFWRQRGFQGDQLLLPALVTLTSVGLFVMVSVRDPLRDLLLVRPFAQGVVLGCVLLALLSQLDLERSRLRRVSFLAVGAAALLSVLLVVFGDGPGTSDAKVNLWGFQPVEAIKVLTVLFLAGYFFERWELLRELDERRVVLPGWLGRFRLPKLEYLLPPVASMLLVLLFFFLQRDLGPALVLSFLFLCLYYVARGRLLMVAVCLILLVAGFTAGYKLGVPATVASRIDMWLAPWDNPARGGEHLAHSLWSFSSGALSGTGLGRGQPALVPEVHTDMVLSAAGEELGFVGLICLLALYALILQRGFRATLRAEGVYSFFLALGLTLVLGLQIVLIAGGVLGFLPLSGVVTPFISYGRSAMLANFSIAGLLLAVSAHAGSAQTAATSALRLPTRRLAAALGLLLVGIAVKAAMVQAVHADQIALRGTRALQADGVRRYLYNPRLVAVAARVPRGTIVDRNGVVLATSRLDEVAAQLPVYRDLGLDFEPAELTGPRFYPLGGSAFHLLGNLNTRVNWAAPNTSFVERDSAIELQGYRDQPKQGTPGAGGNGQIRAGERDHTELLPLLRDRYRPSRKSRQFLERDRTVRLTIDARLQTSASEILRRAIEAADRSRGALVVLEVGSGKVLASVSHPQPRDWASGSPLRTETDGSMATGDAEIDPRLLDRARYGVYPPGSTFKLVTAIAALRKSPQLAGEKYLCQPLSGGRVGHTVRGWRQPIRDDPTATRAHGNIGLFDALTRSCNAYFAQLATYGIGPTAMLETASRFGIEVAQPNTSEKARDLLPQVGYGQGQVLATPWELSRLVATLADGGRIPRTKWLEGEDDVASDSSERLLDRSQAERITAAMRRVVTEGSAARALSEIRPAIAGKTGTAEVTGRSSHSWFVGYAPYARPGEGPRRQIAFSILIENGGYGGRAAAGAARDLVREAVGLGLIDGSTAD